MAAMLLERHATVTIAHSRTPDLAGEVGRADVVVAAIGKAEMVKGAWVKPGAVVIDVGMNRLADGKLVGDVEFAEAARRAAAITPVPGGVGPMTIAMLLANTVELARGRRGEPAGPPPRWRSCSPEAAGLLPLPEQSRVRRSAGAARPRPRRPSPVAARAPLRRLRRGDLPAGGGGSAAMRPRQRPSSLRRRASSPAT